MTPTTGSMRMLLSIGAVAWFVASSDAVIREYGWCDQKPDHGRVGTHFYYTFIKNAVKSKERGEVWSPIVVAFQAARYAYEGGSRTHARLPLLGFPEDRDMCQRQLVCLKLYILPELSVSSEKFVDHSPLAPALSGYDVRVSFIDKCRAKLLSRIMDWFGADKFGDPRKILKLENQLLRVLDPMLEKGTQLIASRVSFNGAFESKFDVSLKNRKFLLNDGGEIVVPTIEAFEKCKCGTIPHLRSEFIGIPVKVVNGSTTIAYFIRPEKPGDFDHLIKYLHVLNVESFVDAQERNVYFRLPKFKVTSTMDVTLNYKGEIVSLGETVDPKEIKLERFFIHKTTLEFSEKGFGDAKLLNPGRKLSENRKNHVGTMFTLLRPFVVMIVSAGEPVPLLTAIVTEPSVREDLANPDPNIASGSRYGFLPHVGNVD